MIADILLSWNELTVIVALSLAVISLALAADVGPEIYQEKQYERKVNRKTKTVAAGLRKTLLAHAEAIETPAIDETMALGVFVIDQPRKHGSHRRVAA